MKTSLYDYCKEKDREELLQQWHFENNHTLTPETVTYGSSKKVWWRCEKGHEWQAAVCTRTTAQRNCPYCAGKKTWAGENDLASQYPTLAAQWNTSKNCDLTPDQVGVGAHKKVWWRCEKGHEWQAVVYSRVRGGDCPVCSGARVEKGENDLASCQPHLASQWVQERNGPLRPDQVSVYSNRKVWWKCELGHIWKAPVATRTNKGGGCPYCAGQKVWKGFNDLATKMPSVAAQWHPTLNGTLTPERVTAGCQQKVWWRCEKGHEWQAVIYSRVNGADCPICSGVRVVKGENDLATLYPRLAAQWAEELNAPLCSDQISAYSNRRVWWRCELGHTWKAIINARTGQETGCPYCTGRKVLKGFNDLVTKEPDLAAQWHPQLNGTLTPEDVTVGSHQKVWWECQEGHVWKAFVYTRTKRKSGCPVCAGNINKGRQRYYADILAAIKPNADTPEE